MSPKLAWSAVVFAGWEARRPPWLNIATSPASRCGGAAETPLSAERRTPVAARREKENETIVAGGNRNCEAEQQLVDSLDCTAHFIAGVAQGAFMFAFHGMEGG